VKKKPLHLNGLLKLLRAFQPGDLLEAAELREAMEQLIVAEETSFDDAALLSKVLEDFTAVVQGAVDEARWQGFLASLPGKKAPAKTPEKSAPLFLQVDPEVLQSFLVEAREHLEDIEPRILSLEAHFDSLTVNEIFRSIHTIKGVSGFLNLEQIKSLSHELEFLLDGLRTGVLTTSSAVVDVLLQGCDLLQKMVADLSTKASAMRIEKGVGHPPFPRKSPNCCKILSSSTSLPRKPLTPWKLLSSAS